MDSQQSALARIDIPAGRLRADDYIVELLDVETSIRQTEQYRYFFSVRGERAKDLLEEAKAYIPHPIVTTTPYFNRHSCQAEAAECLRGAVK